MSGDAYTPSVPEGFESLSDVFAVCAAGYEKREDLIERLCDKLVELWHEGDYGVPLSEFMGLTPEQYAAYVEQRYESV